MEEILIEPNKTLRHIGRDLWQYRELFFFLAWRNLLVRYKQTVIGVLWAVLRPLLTMAIFTVVFSKIAKLPSFDVPYPLLVYAAILPWQFFSTTISESSESLINDSSLISKVYFPRLIIPTCPILAGLVDLGVSLVLFLGFMLFFQITPTVRLFLLPLLIILVVTLTLGIGYLFSALTIRFRDFRHLIPFSMQIGFFISPIGFSSQIVPEQWRAIYSLNPLVGIIEGFRWALLAKDYPLDLPALSIAICLSVAIFILGFNFFIKNERGFADLI